MAKKLRRPLSIILSIMMILSVFTIIPVTSASAAETTVTWNSSALVSMYMSAMSGSESKTQDGVTVTMTASGGPMDFGTDMSINGTGNFTFSTELGNITQIVISFSDSGSWIGANAGWPSWLEEYAGGTFIWSGTPASSVTLSGSGGSSIYGITSIVFTISAEPTYTVTWKNYDGSVLETDADVAEGATPEYNGETPVKPTDEEYSYIFTGWTPDVAEAAADIEYTATFEAVAKHSHDDIVYEPWVSTDSLPAEQGNYYLMNDVALSVTWTVPTGETNLCLNGHSISYTGTNGSVIQLNNANEKLTVYDCGTTGAITGGNTTGNGGGVKITAGTFELKSGKIEGNVASNGGGVSLEGSGYFIMSGGTIQYNCGYGNTGGVLEMINNFTMTGGVIQYNVGKNYGGIGIASSQPKMSGTPVVKDNVLFSDVTRTNTKITKTDNGYTLATGGTPSDIKHATGNGLKINIVGALQSGAEIGIFNNNQVDAFTSGYATYNPEDDPKDYFFSNASERFIMCDAAKEAQLGGYFTVTWKNPDGEIIETDEDVVTGTTPEFNGTLPEKPEDDEATYTTLWSPEIAPITGNTTYTAYYRPTTKRLYKIHLQCESYNFVKMTLDKRSLWSTFDASPIYNGTNKSLHHLEIISGGDVMSVSGKIMTIKKPGTARFMGYVSSNGYINFTATVTPYYTVTWKNYDGTVLKADEVLQGTTPSYDGETPAKAEDENYTYTFAGWTDGETTYAPDALPAVTGDTEYTATITATEKYVAVAEMINALPTEVTVEDADAIKAARAAYDALSDKQKALVDADTLAKLEAAEEALEAAEDQAAANEVTQTIDELPTEVTVEDADAIKAARAAYDALSDKQKALVDANTLAKLTAAEEALAAAEQAAADQAAADEVTAMINALPTEVTVNDKEAIEAARAAYDALSDEQKALVDANTLAKLTAAEEALAAAEKAAADEVTAMIEALPTEVTVNNKEAIEAARAAYDALSDELKALVDANTLAKLTAAEEALAAAEQAAADQAAADEVVQLINAIGTVKYNAESKAKLNAAKAAYDALTDAQKALVTNYTTLTDAEEAYAALKLAPVSYNKDSEEVFFGVVLQNPGDTIDASNTPKKLRFDIAALCDYRNTHSGEYSTHNAGKLWSSVESFYINDNFEFICYNFGITSRLIPAEGRAFMIYYDPFTGEWHIGDAPAPAADPTGTYTVTWKDYDGTILEVDNDVAAGTVPSYDSENPMRSDSEYYTYVFAGWGPVVGAVNGDTTYTARYRPVAKQEEGLIKRFTFEYEYEVDEMTIISANSGSKWIWSDYNGGKYDYTGLAHQGSHFVMTYSYIDYDGAYQADNWMITPAIELPGYASRMSFYTANANSEYPEKFDVCIGTSPDPAKMTVIKTVTPVHDGGKSEDWDYIEIDLTAYAGQTIYVGFHDTCYDEYEGWLDLLEFRYDVTTPAYTVTWKNGETELDSYSVASGTVPTYNGEAPTQEENEQYTYTFAGWTDGETTYAPNELPAVTANVTYTAVFNSTDKYVEAVISMIADLPDPADVTVDDQADIEAATIALLSLTADQIALVPEASKTRLQEIVNAFADVAQAAADQAAADGVTYLINQIPAEVSANDAEAIENARAAYNMLTDDQKALINADTLAKLTAAEDALDAINNPLTNLSVISEVSVPKDTRITVTGNAEGGKGDLKYAFYYKKSTSSAWTTLGELYGKTTEVNFAPATVGKYLVKVNVKDSTGKIVTKIFEVNSTKPTGDDLVNKSTLDQTTVVRGTPITITGAAIGGAGGYKYAFYYKKTTSKAFTLIGEEFGDATTATFTPASSAKYNVRINVMDSEGRIVTKQYKIVSTAQQAQ